MTEGSEAAVGTPLWRRALASRGLQALLALLVFAWVLRVWLEGMGGAEALRERYGLAAAAILVPVQATFTVFPFFAEMIAVTNAAVYGFWLGSLLSWLAWMLTALVHYALVRRTVLDFDLDLTYERLPRWFRRFPPHHPAFLIGVRIPLGGAVANTVAGAFGVPLWRHMWCAALAIAPRAFFFSALARAAVS